MRILILGGYGVFGGKLVHLIGDLAGLEILVAGRDATKAREFCQGWRSAAHLRPLLLDRAHVAAALAGETPDLVVDASGPFQSYGSDPYGVVRAAIAAGVNYLDFADGAEFVAGIAQFDAAARAAGVFVLSGVSSFPVLTAAVLHEIAKDMTIKRVIAGIAPSPHAGIGQNVMRAVLSYAGSPVVLRRGGRKTTGIGLGESLRYTIAPPGEMPLDSRRFSLVDVPDLRVIPGLFPDLTDIWVGAAPVPDVLLRLLNLLAWLRFRLHLPRFSPLAPMCHRVLNALRFGPHRGGMFVQADGLVDGKPVQQSWHLLAEGDDGPLIPAMAIEAIIRRIMLKDPPAPGARTAWREVSLADYQVLFRRRTIRSGWRDGGNVLSDRPLYARILGDRYARLPPELQALHQPQKHRLWYGRADVMRSPGLAARAVAGLFGFPATGRDQPVEISFGIDAEGRETWTRRFSGKTMRSRQEAGRGRNAHLLVERFGPVAVARALVIRNHRLELVPRRWAIAGLPMPRALMPRGQSYETVTDGRFRFHVEITLPLIGRVVQYHGWLEPVAAKPAKPTGVGETAP